MNSIHLVATAAARAPHSQAFRPKAASFGILLLLWLLTLGVARADQQDDDYLRIYGIIDQADALSTSGKTSAAHAKYLEAQWELTQFQRANPNWNTRTVTFRLNSLADKVAATSGNPAAAGNDTSGSDSSRASVSTGKKAVALGSKSAVRLLGAGAEPRTLLRLHPAVGDQQALAMTMKMAMAMKMAGKDMPATSLPAMIMSMNVEVKEVAADGEITYELVFNDVTVSADATTPPGVAEAMKAPLASIRGMSGIGKMSDHGVVKSLEMKVPATADPQFAQSLDQMKESFSSSTTPLPDEAVGPGAKWEYVTRVKTQGMTIDQTMTYELVAIEGDRLTLRSTILQNAANQKIQNPSMPGLKVDLTKMSGVGTGNSTFDQTHIMPVTGNLAEKMEIIMSVPMGQQKQSMAMKMDMNISFETK